MLLTIFFITIRIKGIKNNDISCSAIYNKHRQIIDLIYENREDKVLQRSKICRDVLKNMGDDIETDKSNSKAYINFWTTGLEQLFQNVDKKYYHYLIEIRKDHIGLYLEYHKDKKEVLKDETFNAMQNAGKNFVEALKEKNTKDGDWNWYRVWSVILHNSLDDETRIRKWIEEEISKIKEKDGTNRIKDELIQSRSIPVRQQKKTNAIIFSLETLKPRDVQAIATEYDTKLVVDHTIKEVSEKKIELIQKVAEIKREINYLRQKVDDLDKLIDELDI